MILGVNGIDRYENIIGYGYRKDWSIMNFVKLSENFVEEVLKLKFNN